MSGIGLRTRITVAVMVAAVLPAAAFGIVLVVSSESSATLSLVLLALVGAALVGLVVGGYLVAGVVDPLRALAARLDKITAGELADPLPPLADDELGRLADRQEELAADLARRNSQVARVVEAVTSWSPRDGADALISRAAGDARTAFGLLDARIELGDPGRIEYEERVPGDPLPVRAVLRAGREPLGMLVAHAPATARWEPADQDLLELFAASVAVGLGDAELFARVEEQNARLVAIDAEKDDFLRGVSHNLQTPLARIRAYADQIAGEQASAQAEAAAPTAGAGPAAGAGQAAASAAPVAPDRRLAIIAEQSERLSRMVRQLLTVSRVDSGVLRPVAEVFALGPRVRRAWEALGAGGVPFELVDESRGWLAVADADQVDQVVWALLDNAVKYGGGTAVSASLAVDAAAGRVRLTIADRGPGVAEADRDRLFARYVRGGAGDDRDGTGLGLYVGRALARANDGDLLLEPAAPGRGAALTLELPAEAPTEG